MLHGLCRQYGTRRVWETGMRVLGFPPVMVTGGAELLTLQRGFTDR